MYTTHIVNHNMLQDKLLNPLVYVLAVSDRLVAHPATDRELVESLDVIHQCAVGALRCVRKAVDIYASGQIEDLSHMLHDLFSPSSTLLSYCDFILSALSHKLNSQLEIQLETIVFRTHHARYQLYNLIDYARIQTQPPDEMVAFKLHTLLQKPIISHPHIASVTWDIPEDLPSVYSSRLYIGHSIINLVINAIQASKNRTVSVKAHYNDDHVWMQVMDVGCGMTDEIYQKMVMPFYQGEPCPDQLGLGLTVAVEYIRLQGGTLEIESIEDKGTIATFDIPTFRKP